MNNEILAKTEIKSLENIKESAKYGVIEGGIFSFHRPRDDDGWSEENDDMIEESSKYHFIDVESRNDCLTALERVLSMNNSLYCDFGCSSGWLIEDVKKRFSNTKIIGSDYYSAGLIKLRKRNQDINLCQFDLCDIPFNDNSLDAFSCLNVLEHVKDDVKAMKELKRVLKPKGIGYIMVPASPALYDFYDEVHLHERRYRKNSFNEKLLSAGFEIEHLNYFATTLYWPFFLVKKLKNQKFKNKSLKEKRLAVLKEINKTQESSYSDIIVRLLKFERMVSNYIPFPFGIRLCAIVKNR